MGRWPDFLVIGAARAGTTALHAYLRQAPDVFMPATKEPDFFAYAGQRLDCKGPGADFINNSVTDAARYLALFADAPPGALCGEASPLYLYEPAAAATIARHIPSARLVAVLRNPLDQAFSHYLYATKYRIEPLTDFTEALRREDERMAAGWQPLFGYSRFPRYAEQLARFQAHFPAEQLLVRTYEDFQDDPQTVLADILAHIGADASFHPDMREKLNAGGRPRNAAFQDFLMKSNPVTRAIGLVVPQRTRLRIRDRLAALNLRRDDAMPRAARAILHDRLDDQIRALGPMIGRDLSHWLQ
jgi:hypothetical protein